MVLCLVAACARVPVEVPPSGPPFLVVVTWNLNAGRGELPALIDDLAAGRLTPSPVLDYVVLVQEALDGGTRDVQQTAASRGLSSYFAPVWRAPSGGLGRAGATAMGNAILSTLPLTDARTIELPRERQARTAARADVLFRNVTLFVVSTHFENRLGWRNGFFADRARRRQADVLLRNLPEGQPGIVGGDLNTMLGPEEPALQLLLARFPDTPPRPAPTFRDRLVLDHLFFDLPATWAATRAVVANRYGSDHHPVLGIIR
jgi:endonuclease/exonuclease/phosphatase family metal-dependent hydrolase